MELKFRIQGEALDMNIQLPEMSTSRPVLLALSSHARTANRFHNVNFFPLPAVLLLTMNYYK